jgi:hypothetical protein
MISLQGRQGAALVYPERLRLAPTLPPEGGSVVAVAVAAGLPGPSAAEPLPCQSQMTKQFLRGRTNLSAFRNSPFFYNSLFGQSGV